MRNTNDDSECRPCHVGRTTDFDCKHMCGYLWGEPKTKFGMGRAP